jgi:hypothetical protein
MVRMLHLKTRLGHATIVGSAIVGLLHLPCAPVPSPKPTRSTTPTSGGGDAPRRRWEKGLTPKKPIIPPTPEPNNPINQTNKTKPSNFVLDQDTHSSGCTSVIASFKRTTNSMINHHILPTNPQQSQPYPNPL